ncbi:MAG: homocysteine methyltransferase [bacterium]
MSYPYLIQGDNIIIVMNNKTHTVNKTHVAYNKLLEAIKQEDWKTVENVIDPKAIFVEYGEGHISIKGEKLFWKDRELANSLAGRVVRMFQEGFPIRPMVLFIENLMKNPSNRAVNELYTFLENNNLPITDDGHFLAYKKVRDNYRDVYSGKIDNSVGQTVTMDRNAVDDQKERTCSYGLHFCSKEYLQSFGGERVMILKINPRDVVSIPIDYGFSKGRCCQYTVIAEYGVDENTDIDAGPAVHQEDYVTASFNDGHIPYA